MGCPNQDVLFYGKLSLQKFRLLASVMFEAIAFYIVVDNAITLSLFFYNFFTVGRIHLILMAIAIIRTRTKGP